MEKQKKIIIPGAAGLVGQNLVITLKEAGYRNIVAIDKCDENLKVLQSLHPDITTVHADLSELGAWQESFNNGEVIIMLQAQIGAKSSIPFIRNNIASTKNVLETAKAKEVPYIIHISSSVVESVAEDDYTNTKREQEEMVAKSGINYCILRPTLMFGWFDRKHLGWLSRFMSRVPVFPIPGSGKYMRQPLYVRDFCNIISSCIKIKPSNSTYNITGKERVDYIDIIKTIRDVLSLRTLIVKIPYWLFWTILKGYSLLDKDPPFTTDQLKALVTRDEFEVIPWWDIFSVKPTPFKDAIRETFLDHRYSNIALKF